MEEQRYSLSLMTLFGYLEALPTSRCIIEGEAIANSQHVITCGILKRTSVLIEIFALCLKTSALQDKPHEIKGQFEIINKQVKIVNFSCSCKAGLSKKCKHVTAVLILCTRQNILSLPQLASTDVKCYWSKVKATENYAAIPILEHECFARKVFPMQTTTNISATDIIAKFTRALPNSAIAKHIKTRHAPVNLNSSTSAQECNDGREIIHKILEQAKNSDLQNFSVLRPTNQCCENFFNNICDVDIAAVTMNTKSNRAEWVKERQFRITGSRCYSLYTYASNDWETKARKYFWPKSFTSKFTNHGQQFEDVARSTYITHSGQEVVQTGLILSKHHPWLGYSPDGIVIKNGIPSALLEIKCPYEGKSKTILDCTIMYLNFQDNIPVLKKKHMYYGQVQLGLAILNLPECDLFIYASSDNTFINVKVQYDKDFIQNLILKLQSNYINKMIHVICTEEKENKVL